ncbi:MAG: hypothetical protein H6742_04635 [Alphaproteobacteria bacterium]|nr:hypothetical protein [Alphaproteobacteria bacterium]
MGRFDGIGAIVQMVFDAVGIEPQPWMSAVFLGLAIVLVGPAAMKNIRTAQARKRVVRLNELSPTERPALQEEILGLVRGNPQGLVAIADEAARRRQRPLAVAAYQELRRGGDLPKEVLRLHEELYGKRPDHPEEEAAAIERLIDAGALDRARERLAVARSWFPGDDSLRALQDRLAAASGGGAAPTR